MVYLLDVEIVGAVSLGDSDAHGLRTRFSRVGEFNLLDSAK